MPGSFTLFGRLLNVCYVCIHIAAPLIVAACELNRRVVLNDFLLNLGDCEVSVQPQNSASLDFGTGVDCPVNTWPEAFSEIALTHMFASEGWQAGRILWEITQKLSFVFRGVPIGAKQGI